MSSTPEQADPHAKVHDDLNKTLKALRTRIAEVESQANLERAGLPPRLAAAAFAVAVFVLAAVPWVTVGDDRPEDYSLWGLVGRLEGPTPFALVLVLALAGVVLGVACLAEPAAWTPVVVWVMTGLVLFGLFWVSQAAGEEFGDRYDDDVAWWPAPWLLVICTVAAAAAVSSRKR